jgi:hypothetical protein
MPGNVRGCKMQRYSLERIEISAKADHQKTGRDFSRRDVSQVLEEWN